MFFSLFPSSTAVTCIELVVDMLYPVGIVILLGFSSSFKSKHFFKGLFYGLFWVLLQTVALVAKLVTAVSV